MANALPHKYKPFLTGFLYSYSQIFFSKKPVFALCVLLVSFLDWRMGLAGASGVLLSNGFAWWLGFDRKALSDGLFGFNSLFVCMALGQTYQFNLQLGALIVVSAMLCLLVTVGLSAVLRPYGLPFLSLPFVFVLWIVLFAVRSYSAVELSEGNIFLLNYLYEVGGLGLVDLYEWIEALPIPEFISAYFKSLGAICFQPNLLAGVLLTIGLLLHSRIAFLLSLVGFAMGYLFYYWIGGNPAHIHYSYIGFNFILVAIGLGGFFFLPTKRIFLLVIAVSPIIAVIIGATTALMLPWQLPVYSFPFAIVVMLVVYASHFAQSSKIFQKPVVQQYSPERNLYFFQNQMSRFSKATVFRIHLPFFGEWTVSQGHGGKPTHQGDWKEAWDFVVEDAGGKTYEGEGRRVEDFFAYNLPVNAPAEGWVVAVVEHVPDNAVGGVNVEDNWGNTVVVKHGEYLYSKVSHLKKGSIKVKVGEYVHKGQALGNLGNSGRSPEPHIHFQLQATAYVGATTLKYPLAYYMQKDDAGKYAFRQFQYPGEGEVVSNVKTTPLLVEALSMQPGMRFRFAVERNGTAAGEELWEVFTSPDNQRYVYSKTTDSTAYFENDGVQLYFTAYYGRPGTLLHHFFLGAYRLVLGYYDKLKITDEIPVYELDRGLSRVPQDFLAPFWRFSRNEYALLYSSSDSAIRPKRVELHSEVRRMKYGSEKSRIQFRMLFEKQRLERFEVEMEGGERISAQYVD